jgi:hypothetical protein
LLPFIPAALEMVPVGWTILGGIGIGLALANSWDDIFQDEGDEAEPADDNPCPPKRNRDKKNDNEKKPHKSTGEDKRLIDRIADDLGLSEKEKSQLHRNISHEHYSEDVIWDIGQGIKNGEIH